MASNCNSLIQWGIRLSKLQAINAVPIGAFANSYRSFSSGCRSHYSLTSTIGIRDHHFFMLQHDIEKLQKDSEKMRKYIKKKHGALRFFVREVPFGCTLMSGTFATLVKEFFDKF